jgi:WD40 repeat protein
MNDSTVKVWSATQNGSWNLKRTYSGHSWGVHGLEIINDVLIASCSSDGTIQIWSVTNGALQRKIDTGFGAGHSPFISLKLLSNGVYLASGLLTGNIHIYSIATGNLIANLLGHTNGVYGLSLITSNLLASSGADKTVRIWDTTTFGPLLTLKGHNGNIFGLKLISSDILASASMDYTVILWNTTSGTLIKTLANHSDRLWYSVDLYIQPNIIITGSWDHTLKLWDIDTGQVLRTINDNNTLWIRRVTVFDLIPTTSMF